MTVCVITVSDRASRGEYEDKSGPAIEQLVLETYPECHITRELVPDEIEGIRAVLERNTESDFILTTGGTGLSARDVTPEATELFCDKRLPGIEESLRAASLKETTSAMLSRGYAGVRGATIVINFPGSVRAVTLCTQIVVPIMGHAIKMLRGEGH